MKILETVSFLAWFLFASPLAFLSDQPTAKRCQARGVVKEISVSGQDLHVVIHHEKIDNFHDRDGSVVQVAPMMMVFAVSDKVPRAVWTRGSKVAFAFEVRWDRDPTLQIVHIEPLPETIQLRLHA
ncbi:MAG: hypothetical protein ABW321_27755 [Polyangiales bacterium]